MTLWWSFADADWAEVTASWKNSSSTTARISSNSTIKNTFFPCWSLCLWFGVVNARYKFHTTKCFANNLWIWRIVSAKPYDFSNTSLNFLQLQWMQLEVYTKPLIQNCTTRWTVFTSFWSVFESSTSLASCEISDFTSTAVKICTDPDSFLDPVEWVWIFIDSCRIRAMSINCYKGQFG